MSAAHLKSGFFFNTKTTLSPTGFRNYFQEDLKMLNTYVPTLDLQRRFPFLEKKKALLLHPRRAWVPDPFTSKIGGQIAWPRNEDWPKCPVHNTSLVSVLQLRRSDAPQLIFPNGKDLFQLLWCPTQDHEENGFSPLAKTFWRNSKTIHNVHKRAPQDFVGGEEECIPHECELHLEEVEEYPSSSELHTNLDQTQLDVIDRYIARHGQEDLRAVNGSFDDPYSSLFDPASGSKVAGHVSWIQDPESEICPKCGAEMQHLLTISSSEMGEPDSRWRVMVDENGTSLNTDEMGEEYETGLCLGDMGSVYVMVCRRCEDRPITTFFQCS